MASHPASRFASAKQPFVFSYTRPQAGAQMRSETLRRRPSDQQVFGDQPESPCGSTRLLVLIIALENHAHHAFDDLGGETSVTFS